MVAGAFPIIKLGTLAFRQIAKPLANVIKNRAKESPFFRTYICMPPAQTYHWLEVNVKMKLLGMSFILILKPITPNPSEQTSDCMLTLLIYYLIQGLGKPSSVQKLNEQMAIELGAEMLGEFIIFSAAVITLGLEYTRQARKGAAEAQALEERWNGVESRIEELEFLVDKQSTEIRELTRIVYTIKPNPNPNTDKKK